MKKSLSLIGLLVGVALSASACSGAPDAEATQDVSLEKPHHAVASKVETPISTPTIITGSIDNPELEKKIADQGLQISSLQNQVVALMNGLSTGAFGNPELEKKIADQSAQISGLQGQVGELKEGIESLMAGLEVLKTGLAAKADQAKPGDITGYWVLEHDMGKNSSDGTPRDGRHNFDLCLYLHITKSGALTRWSTSNFAPKGMFAEKTYVFDGKTISINETYGDWEVSFEGNVMTWKSSDGTTTYIFRKWASE